MYLPPLTPQQNTVCLYLQLSTPAVVLPNKTAYPFLQTAFFDSPKDSFYQEHVQLHQVIDIEFTALSASVMPGYIQDYTNACRRQPERKK